MQQAGNLLLVLQWVQDVPGLLRRAPISAPTCDATLCRQPTITTWGNPMRRTPGGGDMNYTYRVRKTHPGTRWPFRVVRVWTTWGRERTHRLVNIKFKTSDDGVNWLRSQIEANTIDKWN